MTAREVMQRLRREGWTERDGNGSHVIFTKDGRMVVVADHPGDIARGTLRSICKQAGSPFPPSWRV